MAINLETLKVQVREISDQQNNEFISDTELTTYINFAYSDLYDLLVVAAEDYFLQTNTFTLTQGGDVTYTIPENFYKLRGIDKIFGNQTDSKVSLYKYNFNERHRFSRRNNFYYNLNPCPMYRVMGNEIHFEPVSSAPGDYKIYYIQKFVPLEDASDEVEQNCDIWNQFIVIDAAIKCVQKEESDPSVLMGMRQNLVDRIMKASANRDASLPERVGDTSGGNDGEGSNNGGWFF